MYEQLREYPDRFKKYFNVSVEQFDHLFDLVSPHLNQKDPLPGDFRLAVTLK